MKPEPTAALLIFIVCQEEGTRTNSACVSVSRGNRVVNCVNEPDRELITKHRNHESLIIQANRSTYVRVDPVLGRPPAMGHGESLSSDDNRQYLSWTLSCRTSPAHRASRPD